MANSLAQYLANLQVQIKETESRLVFGVVISTSPLRVKYGEITLEDNFLFVEDGVPLTVGQKVPMLKTNRSQVFIVMLSKEMTPQEILSKIKTVDGSGSGLDADLLDGKHASDFSLNEHTQAWETLTGVPATATRWPTWTEVTSKPTTFPPETHNQDWSTVDSKPDTATRWPTWSEVTSKPTTFPPSTHTHPIDSVTNVNASGNGLAIGKVSEKDSLEIAMPTEFQNTVKLGSLASYGTGYLSTIRSHYAFGSGMVVEVLPDDGSRMFEVEIKGNAYSFKSPIHTIVTGYWYPDSDSFWTLEQANFGYPLAQAVAMRLNGKILVWFPYDGPYQTWHIEVRTSFGVVTNFISYAGAEPAGTHKRTARVRNTLMGTSLHADPGYSINPDGLITQWGTSTMPAGAGSQRITYPVAFPTSSRFIGATANNTPGAVFSIYDPQLNAVTFVVRGANGAVPSAVVYYRWFAMGH